MPAWAGVSLAADRDSGPDSRSSRPMPAPTVLGSLAARCGAGEVASDAAAAARAADRGAPSTRAPTAAACAAARARYSASTPGPPFTTNVRARLAQ